MKNTLKALSKALASNTYGLNTLRSPAIEDVELATTWESLEG